MRWLSRISGMEWWNWGILLNITNVTPCTNYTQVIYSIPLLLECTNYQFGNQELVMTFIKRM